jgi:hypothetical protein
MLKHQRMAFRAVRLQDSRLSRSTAKACSQSVQHCQKQSTLFKYASIRHPCARCNDTGVFLDLGSQRRHLARHSGWIHADHRSNGSPATTA